MEFKFLQPTKGTQYERRMTSGGSRATPQEQMKANAINQLKLFRGEEVLSASGNKVQPTFERLGNGIVRVGIKFGGVFVELLPGETHLRTTEADFPAAVQEIVGAIDAGNYDQQLAARSAAIAAKLRRKKMVSAEAA